MPGWAASVLRYATVLLLVPDAVERHREVRIPLLAVGRVLARLVPLTLFVQSHQEPHLTLSLRQVESPGEARIADFDLDVEKLTAL